MATRPLIAERILQIEESATLAMAQKSRELQKKGIDIINLSIGEPDFFVPQFIKEAAIRAIEENYSFYPPVAGFPELREAIAKKLLRDNNLVYSPDQIVVSNGAKQAIANAFFAILDPGDEVIIPAPYWVSYTELVKLAGGVPVIINSSIENEFKIFPEQIEEAITSRTRAFIFSSPNNPSGLVYSKEELKEFAQVFAKYPDIYILSDEIYELINFKGKTTSIAEFEEIHKQVIVINGLSKAFAMPGWRIGYSASNPVVAKAIQKVQGQMTSGANTIGQRAAIAALEQDPEASPDLQKMIKAFQERRDYLVQKLIEIEEMIPNHPDGAFYVFPNVELLYGKSLDGFTILNDNDVCMYLLNEAHVALVPGSSFGSPGYIRFSYATSMENLQKAMERIEKALKKLH
ncbi:MAG: pyridoxal phosphate-dependent aminotransferase [Bacteroidales bacterium]|nr:pyridoxal phosphate-dependent aminotransferase [Bacteroidales bacterium]